MVRLLAVAVGLFLSACAGPGASVSYSQASRIQQLRQLLPADVILLGEQHDARDHQEVHRTVVSALAAQKTLAALTLEMAGQGRSTAQLASDASEDAVREALQWNNEGWPWAAYGPAVMAAVRSGVPVLGANLPASQNRSAMSQAELDALLSAAALKAQQQNVRSGHCEMLPESQIAPMTRIQIARDRAMAQTVSQALQPGKTVVLLAGGGHVDRQLGVPLHLSPALRIQSVLMQAEPIMEVAGAGKSFDAIWLAKPAPPVDYCAKFNNTRRPQN
jgi:uncharacterized iron-regulated protein